MESPSLAEQIATQLRRDILRGKLPPDSAVKERDNAIEMGVSRTPMREAIRILAQEGLLVLRPSRSPIVANPSFKEISDAVSVLLVLELLSADLACKNASDNDLATIRAINDRMAENYDELDPLDLFEIDMSFHIAIAKASHNQALAETHHDYLARLWRARFLSASQRRNREKVFGHHNAIMDGLESRDPGAVKATLLTHLGDLSKDIRPVIEGNNKPNSTKQ